MTAALTAMTIIQMVLISPRSMLTSSSSCLYSSKVSPLADGRSSDMRKHQETPYFVFVAENTPPTSAAESSFEYRRISFAYPSNPSVDR